MKAGWRRREDVSRVRFTVALLVAPLPVCVVFGLLFRGDATFDRAVIVGIYLWFLAIGILFDFTMARYRGKISLIDCLTFGVVACATWPSAALTLSTLLSEGAATALGIPSLHVSFGEFLGIITGDLSQAALLWACVIGIFNGWVVWRIGVRPAPEPIQ